MSLPCGLSEVAEIIHDPIKGRCLAATRDMNPGDMLWAEAAFVSATADEEDEREAERDLSLWRAFTKNRTTAKKKKALSLEIALELMDALVELDSVRSLDTARCLLQLIATAMQASTVSLDNAALLFLQLQPANIERCTRDIASFRSEYPSALPEKMSTDFVARLLGVLNNNQMELEDICGSGLFVASAILEHNCSPNCSFSTAGLTIYMMATEAIKAGDRLSIDYGNNYCRPTFYRRIYLYKTYTFFCDCFSCQVPDRTRCFLCPSCRGGSVCAVDIRDTSHAKAETIAAAASGREPEIIFFSGIGALSACDTCLQVPTEEYVGICARTEDEIVNSGLTQQPIMDMSACSEFWSKINELRSADTRVFQEVHYLMFWAVDKIAEFLVQAAAASIASVSDALEKTEEVERLMNIFLPSLHHEKVIILDKLGQLSVSKGDISAASNYYDRACAMSALVCGKSNPATLRLRVLATNTPTSVEDLMSHYNNNSNIALGEQSEDDNWVDEDNIF